MSSERAMNVPDMDFWDRLVLDPSTRPRPLSEDDVIVLTIDDLLPDTSSPEARERARARIFFRSSQQPPRTVASTGIPVPLPGSVRFRSREIRSRRWPLAAAALLVILTGIGAWAGGQGDSYPFGDNRNEAAVIPAPTNDTGNVSMRGVDPGRTNALSGLGFPTAPEQVWTYGSAGDMGPDPTVVDGVVYVGESSLSPLDPGAIVALRADDGAVVWTHPTPNGLSTAFLVQGDTLYALDDGGVLLALDVRNGEERWQRDLNNEEDFQLTWYGSPLMLDGKIVVSSGSSMSVAGGQGAIFVGVPPADWVEGTQRVFALSPQDGSIVWEQSDFTSLAQSGLIALDVNDGSLLWQVSSEPALMGPSYANGLVYFGTGQPARVIAVDAEGGSVRWQQFISDERQWDGTNAAAVSADKVLFSTLMGTVFAFDSKTGDERWRSPLFQLPDQTHWSIATGVTVSGGQGLVLGWDGTDVIIAFDLADGSVTWEIPLDVHSWTSPVVSDQMLFQIVEVPGLTAKLSIVALGIPARPG